MYREEAAPAEAGRRWDASAAVRTILDPGGSITIYIYIIERDVYIYIYV